MKEYPMHLALALTLAACAPDADVSRLDGTLRGSDSESDGLASTNGEHFQRYLDDAVAAGLPGAVLLVRGPSGTWVGASGFADIDGEVPWTATTLGRAGSVTKLFASTLALKLVERGVISSLDVPLRDLVSGPALVRIANADQVTLRQLLNHTSGIYDYLASPTLLQEALGSASFAYQTKEQLLHYAYDQPAAFEPGQAWQYCNTNYLLVELALEAAAHSTGRELMASMVIEPLGLESTTYDPDRPPPERMAHGYADFGDGRRFDVSEHNLERFHFDGGVVSTVEDLSDFLDSVLDSPFLSESSRAELLDVVPTNGASARGTDYYGAGIIVEESTQHGPVYGHLGTSLGFTTHVYRVVNAGITFAAIVNASQAGFEPISYEWFSPLLGDKILDLVAGDGAKDALEAPPAASSR